VDSNSLKFLVIAGPGMMESASLKGPGAREGYIRALFVTKLVTRLSSVISKTTSPFVMVDVDDAMDLPEETPTGEAPPARRPEVPLAAESPTKSGPPPGSVRTQVEPRDLVNIVTPVKPVRLSECLEGCNHPFVNVIVQGFSTGFKINFHGDETSYTARNSLMASTHSDAVNTKLHKELSACHFAGPFDDPPFDFFRCSPLSIRPKKTPGKYR